MLTSIKRIVLLVLIGGLALSGCRKDKFDEYYGRPDSLADPIYQQLNAKGNFTILLKMIDKAGYKDILSKAGYWTFFAPNDAAFTKFFQENSISSADAVTDEMANKIVRYALVYNAFKTDHLADYQSNVGWVLNEGYKRRTAYYDGFYTDASNRVVLSSNRNNTSGTNYYTVGDNNNKYLPYFYSKYFTPKNLTAADYTYFYPNDTFTGFNMAGGKVETTDIIAENGVIHEVSVVNMPLKNIEQHLASNDNYSLFKSILEKYLVTYVKNETATKNYNILTGKSDDVFIKVYDPSLAYSPNNENYLKVTDNDGQTDGYTMFAPNNTSLQAFINTVLLEHFASVDKLPKAIISDLINAHMWQSTVWPSKFATTRNFLGEEARFNNTTDIIEKKVASNGMFYGTNKVQKANVFYTVYSKPYLDPAYSLMTRALNEELKFIITNPNLKFTIFMMSDAVLKAKGFDFDLTRNEWVYVPPGGTNVGGALAKVRIMRILNSSVVFTAKDQLNDLSGSGFVITNTGEYITYNANKVYGSGNNDKNQPVNIVGSKDAVNGRVYYTDNLIEYSELPIGNQLEKLGTATGSQFSNYWNFLKNSSEYDASAKTIKGITLGTFYTYLVPNNAAIQAAVNAGLLPGTGSGAVKTPNYNPSDISDKEKVAAFIQYHILVKKTVAQDEIESGSIETLLKDDLGETTFVNAINNPGSLVFRDVNFRTANIVTGSSHKLADRALIHLLDNYLSYK